MKRASSKAERQAVGRSVPTCCSPFGNDPENEQYTAVWDSIHGCAMDSRFQGDALDVVYDWLEKTPRTSLVVELVNKLHELGYQIVKANPTEQGTPARKAT